MTYGQATRELRDALKMLLTDHPYPPRRPRKPDVRDRREEYSTLIQRYRLPVLQWTLATLNAAVPPRAKAAGIMWAAPAALRHKIRSATDLAQKSVPRPTRELLAAPHPHPVVETWRRAAVAAVRCLTEEHGALDGLSRADALLAIRGTCDLARALVILDDRYQSLPRWQHLSGGRSAGSGGYSHSWGLLRAAERCAMWVNAYALTPELDGRGTHEGDFDHYGTYHLRQQITPGPYPPGPSGVIDALHNGLIRLQRPPSPALLRHLLVHNFHLATQLARLAQPVDESSARLLATRAQTYRTLLEATTNLGGTGSGDPGTTQELDTALSLLKSTKSADHDDINVMHRLLTHYDRRLAHLIRQAIGDQTYLVARGTTVTRSPAGVGTQAKSRLVPITHNSARAFIRATAALADRARTTGAAMETPRPATGLIAGDTLAHRDDFAERIYALRRGTTRISDRAGIPRGPQLRALTHIRHNEITGPAATPEDVRAYLQYAVHNRPRHRRPEFPAAVRPRNNVFGLTTPASAITMTPANRSDPAQSDRDSPPHR